MSTVHTYLYNRKKLIVFMLEMSTVKILKPPAHVMNFNKNFGKKTKRFYVNVLW